MIIFFAFLHSAYAHMAEWNGFKETKNPVQPQRENWRETRFLAYLRQRNETKYLFFPKLAFLANDANENRVFRFEFNHFWNRIRWVFRVFRPSSKIMSSIQFSNQKSFSLCSNKQFCFFSFWSEILVQFLNEFVAFLAFLATNLQWPRS